MSLRVPKNIDAVFAPQSVAVVGATRTRGTVPHDIFQNILDGGFQGVTYPVSPRSPSISGVKAYKYVVDIPDEVDLAIIVFPSSVCHLALEQCGQKGVKAAIIISAGFREVGPAGVDRERQAQEIAAKHGINLIGPNCLGAINTDPSVSLNASFARKMPAEGSIAFLSQSGALCTAVLDYARGKHIGFSKFISFGNKADINEIDLLHYLAADKATKVILIYLEEITDGRGLLEAAQTVIRETGKPILAIKSGRTHAGASAAASHTGSLAGSDDVCDAIFRQAGILRCRTIEEMFNKATALAYQPWPRSDRVAIVTNAGGPGVMATDACVENGLSLARFSEETRSVLKDRLPRTANLNNPVDVIGDARSDRYATALGAVLKDADTAGAMVILTPQSMTDIDAIADEIVRTAAANPDKPVLASFMGEADVRTGIDILQRNHIPHYILPESMASAFAAAREVERLGAVTREPVARFEDVDPVRARQVLSQAGDQGYLPEAQAFQVLEAYGLPVLGTDVAATADEAAAAAARAGFPAVMKVNSPDVVHKLDVGGVMLDIATGEEAHAAFESIVAAVGKAHPEARVDGVTVRRMIPAGQEVILGCRRDPVFGPVIMFGLGGSFVEVFRDVSFRAAPVDEHAVHTMVREVQSFPLLSGARGRAPCDVAAVETCIKRLAQLAVDLPEVAELDMNPVIVQEDGEGAFVADARILVSEPAAAS